MWPLRVDILIPKRIILPITAFLLAPISQPTIAAEYPNLSNSLAASTFSSGQTGGTFSGISHPLWLGV
jgi:hypothetical protein